MSIWAVACALVAAVGYGVATHIQSEAAKETAKINAEAQKHTADQARIAQIESAKESAKAEMHGYDTDKEIEGKIMAQEDKEFEKELAQDKELAQAQWALLDAQYGPDGSLPSDGYDYGYDECGDVELS